MFRLLHIGVFLMQMLFVTEIWGQISISENEYAKLKGTSKLSFYESYSIRLNASRASYSLAPSDSSFVQAIPPSDDGSSALINLPFDFCWWGDVKNEVYINSNGNISFGQSFSTGTPIAMPFSNFQVIAPYWSDVDTRSRGGVFYKLLPNALIVSWEDVGYYEQNDSKGNSFQLIITDGSSELLPFGYTIGFFYDNMEWTTGDGSGGIGGFGGAPAQIGLNYGDGTRYSSIGAFNKNDTSFSVSKDSLNGVLALEGKTIYLNPCDSLNNKPGVLGDKLKDTIGVCIGDTLRETLYFFAPETDQLTYINADTSAFIGQKITNIITGNVASLDLEIVGGVNNIGVHSIPITIIDNGQPGHFYEIELVVQIDSLPEPVNIIGDTIICSYDTTQLSVASVYETYLWSNGGRSSVINVTPGIYTVTVGYNHCEKSVSHLVKANIPNSDIVSEPFICLPDTLELSVFDNNDIYQWNTGDSVFKINITQPGVYSVTVFNDGCVNSDSVEITSFSDHDVNLAASNVNSCNGDSVILFVPDIYDSILWSTGDISNSINVLAGNYLITVTQFSGDGTVCHAYDSILIGDVTYPTLTVSGNSVICGDESTVISVNSVFDSYLWDNGITAQSSIYSIPGLHFVEVSYSTCIDSLSFNILGVDTPSLGILGNLFYCDTVDSARLVAVGDVWDSLFWNTGDITDTIYTGYGWKRVTAWKDGCSSVKWHRVNELINGVDVHGVTEICPGQSTQLTVEFGFDLYQWSNGSIGFSTNINAPGDYWCVVHLDSCFATTDTVTITMNTPDTVQILGDTVMCDTNGGFLYVDLGYQQFIWNTGETSPGISYTNPGIYSVTVEDKGYCVTSDTIDVVVKPSIYPVIQGINHYCFEDSAILNISGFDHYLWSTNETDSSIKVRAGVYSVFVRNNDGCTAKSPLFKVTSSSPEVTIVGESEVCENMQGLLTFNRQNNHFYEWGNGDTLDSIYVNYGQHELRVFDSNGCIYVDTFQLNFIPAPNVGITVDPEDVSMAYVPLTFYDDSQISSGNLVRWFWNVNDSILSENEDLDITFYSGQDLEILHKVWAENGCVDSVKFNYRISDDVVSVNVITPNGDGINDYLEFPNIGKFETNELTIFNRWGVIIFQTTNYRNFWDAYDVPEGVYFYTLYLGQNEKPVQGSFTIVR